MNEWVKGAKMVVFTKPSDQYPLKFNFDHFFSSPVWIRNLDKNLIMALLIMAVFILCFSILKALYHFKITRAHKARCSNWQNVQNAIFEIFKMFKSNMKFTIAACSINSEICNGDNRNTLMIFLYCHYFWSLLYCNYWRSLLLWNSTSWNRLKVII